MRKAKKLSATAPEVFEKAARLISGSDESMAGYYSCIALKEAHRALISGPHVPLSCFMVPACRLWRNMHHDDTAPYPDFSSQMNNGAMKANMPLARYRRVLLREAALCMRAQGFGGRNG